MWVGHTGQLWNSSWSPIYITNSVDKTKLYFDTSFDSFNLIWLKTKKCPWLLCELLISRASLMGIKCTWVRDKNLSGLQIIASCMHACMHAHVATIALLDRTHTKSNHTVVYIHRIHVWNLNWDKSFYFSGCKIQESSKLMKKIKHFW